VACTARTGWAATRCPTCWSSGRGPARPRRTWPPVAATRRTSIPSRSRPGHASWAKRRVGIFREAGDLKEALRELEELRRRWSAVCVDGGRAFNPAWNLVFELGSLLTVSEAVARSALQRRESRGAHSRLDYPDPDDARWGGSNSVIARGKDGLMSVTKSQLPRMNQDLRALLGASH
jgi:succinate dehydrogenase/fumarate reductase flavoprotein subunit